MKWLYQLHSLWIARRITPRARFVRDIHGAVHVNL